MGIFPFFVIAAFVLAILECVYSLYKKDGKHSFSGTKGNILRGFVLVFLSAKMFFLYLGVFLVWADPRDFYAYAADDINVASFLACLLLVDLCWYVFHRVHHTFRFPIALHSVHHSDDRMNFSTAFRISWTEQLYIFFFFLPVLLVGFHPTVFFLTFFYLNAHQFFCHSGYLRLPRFFDLLFVTPHNHSIHHDQVLRNQSSNFGAVFSIWDRLFGTYVPEIATFTPGIKGYHQDNFIKMETDQYGRFFHKT